MANVDTTDHVDEYYDWSDWSNWLGGHHEPEKDECIGPGLDGQDIYMKPGENMEVDQFLGYGPGGEEVWVQWQSIPQG